jgi:hypothetical protein
MDAVYAPCVYLLAIFPPVRKVNGSDVFDAVENGGLHRRPWGVGGAPYMKLWRKQGDKKDESDGTYQHYCGHEEEVAVEERVNTVAL